MLSELDSLTGLPSRRPFVGELERELARAHRLGSTLAVVVLDVDDFRRVADILGHLQADEVLRRLSERLRALARPADTVARLGGDEFGVVLPDATLDDAEHLALRLEIALRVRPLHPPLRIGVTHGLAELAASDDHEGLFRRADRDRLVRRAGKHLERPAPAEPQAPPPPHGRPTLRLVHGGGEGPRGRKRR